EYLVHKDTITSIMLLSRVNSFWSGTEDRFFFEGDMSELARRQVSPEMVPALVRLVTKTSETPYESYLTTQYEIGNANYNAMISSLGSVYLSRNRFKDAYGVFSLIQDSVWGTVDSYLNQNPFVARAGSNHLTSKADTVTYSKKAFTARMIELERLIADPHTPRRDELRKQYADAHFSMTYFGNAWQLVSSWWSVYSLESLKPAIPLTYEDSNYFGCRAARTLYADLLGSTR